MPSMGSLIPTQNSIITGLFVVIHVYAYLSSYPGYFQDPLWLSMGLPEICRVTWQVCIGVASHHMLPGYYIVSGSRSRSQLDGWQGMFLCFWCCFVTVLFCDTVETLYNTIYNRKYFIELNIDKSTQYVALWTHKKHPIPRPFGRAMECLLWVLQQKLIVL